MSGEGRQRIDKWLFFARLVKSRSLGAKLVELGRARINRRKAEKPSDAVHVGDVLTLNLDSRIAVVKVLDLGERRGPAPEAQGLYEDLAPAGADGEDARAPVHFPDAAPALRRAKRPDPDQDDERDD
ncbi:MAG: RNA-binding S4 domain-containing protein [Methylobacterium mesophilicum]|nr:RNA-binding S4 domain-containing protein [Methylobacterium mesophilicum]